MFDQVGLDGVYGSAENVRRLFWFLTDIVRNEEVMMPSKDRCYADPHKNP